MSLLESLLEQTLLPLLETVNLEPRAVLTILGMGLATFFSRVLGYYVISRIAIRGRLAGALQAVPGAVLVALIAPTMFSSSVADTLASAITVALAWRVSTLVALLGGVVSIVLLRGWLG